LSKGFDNLVQGIAWSMLNSSGSHDQVFLKMIFAFETDIEG